MSEERKLKISKAKQGTKLGEQTQSHKNKISKALKGNRSNGDNPNSKKVMHIESNTTYDTLKEAAKAHNMHYTTVSKHCKNKVDNPEFKCIRNRRCDASWLP
jgi:hypothetical protein